MRVEIRPIQTTKWHGKSGKESFTRPKTIEALVDPETLKYKTGLTKEDVELLKSRNISYDISDDFVDGTAHPFWESRTAQIKLENKTMVMFPQKNVLDFIKVKIMKASKFVGNSMAEIEEGLWPEATHVILDEAQELEIKATKTEIRDKAIIACSKLSPERKIQLVMILLGKDVRGKSDNHLKVAVSEMIETKSKDVLRQIDLDSDETEIHALVLACLDRNVLIKKGHKIEYKGSDLGGDEMEVTHYLMDDKNQDLRLRLQAEINN